MKKIVEEYGVVLVVSILILGMVNLFWGVVRPKLHTVLPKNEQATFAFEEMKALEQRQKPVILAEHLHLKKKEIYETKKIIGSLKDSAGMEQREKLIFGEFKEKQAFYSTVAGDELIISCELLDENGNLVSDVEGTYTLKMEYIDSYGIEASKTRTILVT